MAALLHRLPMLLRRSGYVLAVLIILSGMGGGGSAATPARERGVRLTAAVRPAQPGGLCQVPGIGDIGGLLGFCNAGSSGLIGTINNICQPAVPTPEPATGGIDALIRPAAGSVPAKPATLYDSYGVAGQSWAAYDLQCSDMTSLIGNNVAAVVFDAAKALDRLTITVYQSAAGPGILSWLTGAVDRLINSLGKAIYFPYLAPVVLIGVLWLAWQGLIRKRATRTIEGTLWMVIACAAAIWLIGRPADFTGLSQTVSNGMTQTLNVAFAKLPTPTQDSCVPVQPGDPQVPTTGTYTYTSGSGIVDRNANELWTVLVCKPWLDGEFGTTVYSTGPGTAPTVVNRYGRQLLWAQAIAANEKPTASLIQAKEDTFAGIAASIKQNDPSVYPLFQGKQWTTRLEIAFAAFFAALIAGVLVLLIAITLIVLKLGFLLLLVVGPFFLIVGTHPGFGRVIALRWAEMLVGVLLKQAAIALVLSILLYAYSLIMGTSDATLPWALKILMISLVTVAVFIYRRPFAHLFSAVGYGMIGSRERAASDLSRASQSAGRNTLDAATLAIPGFAAYRAARWARRNPGQAAGVAAAVGTAGAGGGGAGGAADGGAPPAAPPDGDGPAVRSAAGAGRARTRADVGVESTPARTPPPLNLPPRSAAGSGSGSGWARSAGNGTAAPNSPPSRSRPPARPGPSAGPPLRSASPRPAASAPPRRVPSSRPHADAGGNAAADDGGARPFWLRPLWRRGPR
jgi:hypothetical protein